MATTVASDLIVPEVWADAVMKEVLGRAVLAPLVTLDSTLEGTPGDTINFPTFNYIGDAVDLTEGVAMTTSKLTMTDGKTTIKEAGKAVELTDKAILTALGRPQDQAVSQLGLAIARKIDTDIRAAAELVVNETPEDPADPNTSPLITPVQDSLDWKAFTVGAALLGDEWDPSEFSGLVIHSAQHIGLMNDPNWIGMDKMGANSAVLRGQVGSIGQVPVIVSDRATRTGDGTEGDPYIYNALLIQRGALTLAYKRRPIVEKDRDILKRTNVVTTNAHYAVKRTNDRGIVVIRTEVA